MSYDQIDLITLVESDLGPGKKSGRWTLFQCPFHNDHKPSFAVTNGDDSRGPCWRCFACGKHGGPMAWFIEYHQMTQEEAKNALNHKHYPSPRRNAPQPPAMPIETPPGDKWQQRAQEVTQRAEESLWSNKGAYEALEWQETDPNTGKPVTSKLSPLDWLLSRGLSDRTLRAWHIGYVPLDWNDSPEKWGLDPSKHKKVFFPQGILIPCAVGKNTWYLKVRRPAAKPKYLHIPGSKPALFMAEELEFQDTAVFCEGELDALLLWQAVRGLVGVVTLGSATNELNSFTWGLYMLNIHQWLLAYDLDKAGEGGSHKLDWLHPKRLNIPRLRPFDKDITDFSKSGGDLEDWLTAELKRINQPQVQKQ